MCKFFKLLIIRNGLRYIFLSAAFIALLLSALFIFPSPVSAEESEDIIINKTDFGDYPRVNIYISFREGSQLEYLDLEQADFVVLENDQEVRNLSIKPLEEVSEPIGIVLAIDTSGSMKGDPIGDAAGAASYFVNRMRSIDKIAVISFADRVAVHSEFTSDHQELKDSISKIQAAGETALYDGIYTACELFGSGYNLRHRYLIVLSDGADTVSSHTEEEVIDIAIREGVSIYSIALLSPEFSPESIKNISESTGGEMLATVDSGKLEELYGKISQKIIDQYKISYTSLWPAGENIEISIDIEKLDTSGSAAVSYENPYYSPPPRKVVFDRVNYFFLTLFNIWWVKIILYAAVFLAVSLLLFAFVLFMPARKQTLKEKAKQYGFKGEEGETEEEIVYGQEERKKGFIGWLLSVVSKIASRRGFVELFEARLQRAGMGIRAAEFMALHFFMVVTIGLLVFYFSRNMLITLLVTVVSVLLPFVILNIKTSRRLKRFHEQLPDALQLISGSLKAGYSFNQALSMVVEESKPPLSKEFRRILNETRMGISEREALGNVSERIKSEYFDWTVMAINVQREVGGNLAEVLETISNTIRERDRVMNRIKALTSESRLSAIILIALPVVVGILLAIINREYISLLFATRIGLIMLIVSGIMMIIGVIWILKIIQIKY